MKSIARKKLEGRLVGGNFSDLANYSDLFERTHDSILLLDQGRFEILQINPACQATLGVGSGDLVGQEFITFFDEFTQARLVAFLSQVSPTALDLVWISTQTSVILELTVSRLELADYCSVLQLIARDVTVIRTQQKKLESLSMTDELTGLCNRRAFNQQLDHVHEAASQSRSGYAVFLLDVDNFKHFNDRNGHAAGDVALREVGRILKGHMGERKFTARYGGEEFAVIVQENDVAKLAKLAEEIRLAIQSSPVPHAAYQPLGFLSVSIGIAIWKSGKTVLEVVQQADEALYVSKEKGRNRVSLADPSK